MSVSSVAYETVAYAGPAAVAVEAWNRLSAEGCQWSADMLTLALSIGTPYESPWILPEIRPRLLAIQQKFLRRHTAQQAREERDRIERALQAEARRQTDANIRKLRRFG
jgi:hypothetical protein